MLAAIALALLGAIPFATATTFTGDDHLFLAFARYVPNPLVAFVRDQHGGEFYRPLAMLPWWILGRMLPGAPWPFAVLSFLLHATVAVEVAMLVRRVRGDGHTAAIAAVLFFVAPALREAAYWYAASTDLLATAFGVGAVLALLWDRTLVASLLVAAACWSKESAIVVPALAAVILRADDRAIAWRTVARRAGPLALVAVGYLVARTAVLGGVGGSGDTAAPFAGKLLQVGAGLLRVAAGADVVGGPAVWILGIGSWTALLFGVARVSQSRRRLKRARLTPSAATPGDRRDDEDAARSAEGWELAPAGAALLWIALAVVPLLAAPWIVGARYFYLASIGVVWLAASLLRRASPVATVAVCAALAGLACAQAITRHGEVVEYQARLSAARRAITAGMAAGYTTFHVVSGIKDLDLAIKDAGGATVDESPLVVLSDVPASFIVLPESRAAELDFLLARPPLPPTGAYRFGSRRIVGLARRGDDPTIDEVIARLPAIRFVRLRLAAGKRVVWRDVTETWRDVDPE
ncbi:MAG: hypothetical protein ABUS79_11465 [Pseudomonadota bacterium]